MRGLLKAGVVLAPALVRAVALEEDTIPSAFITLHLPQSSDPATNGDLVLRFDINETTEACGFGNVLISGQTLGEEGSGSLVIENNRLIDASWNLTCVTWNDVPQEQLLNLNIDFVDGRAVDEVGFTVRFQQVAPVWVSDVEGDASMTRIHSINQPKPDCDDQENDIDTQLAELDNLRWQMHELRQEIFAREHRLAELAGWGRHTRPMMVEDCDNLNCVARTLFHKVKGAALSFYNADAFHGPGPHGPGPHGPPKRPHGGEHPPPFGQHGNHTRNGTHPHPHPHPPPFCKCAPPPPPPPPPPPGPPPPFHEGPSHGPPSHDGLGGPPHPPPGGFPHPHDGPEHRPEHMPEHFGMGHHGTEHDGFKLHHGFAPEGHREKHGHEGGDGHGSHSDGPHGEQDHHAPGPKGPHGVKPEHEDSAPEQHETNAEQHENVKAAEPERHESEKFGIVEHDHEEPAEAELRRDFDHPPPPGHGGPPPAHDGPPHDGPRGPSGRPVFVHIASAAASMILLGVFIRVLHQRCCRKSTTSGLSHRRRRSYSSAPWYKRLCFGSQCYQQLEDEEKEAMLRDCDSDCISVEGDEDVVARDISHFRTAGNVVGEMVAAEDGRMVSQAESHSRQTSSASMQHVFAMPMSQHMHSMSMPIPISAEAAAMFPDLHQGYVVVDEALPAYEESDRSDDDDVASSLMADGYRPGGSAYTPSESGSQGASDILGDTKN